MTDGSTHAELGVVHRFLSRMSDAFGEVEEQHHRRAVEVQET